MRKYKVLKDLNFSSNSGITLVALIITIIVIIILAGISIGSISGKNGILKMAKDSKIMASIADSEETANMAYLRLLKDNDDPTLEDLKNELNNEGYNVTKSGKAITDFTLNKTNVEISKGGTDVIEVTYPSDESAKYYIKTDDEKYHKMTLDDRGNVKISQESANLDESQTDTKTLTATSNNPNIKAEVNGTKITITDTGNAEVTTYITISYGDISKTVSVTVKEAKDTVPPAKSTVSTDYKGGWTNENVTLTGGNTATDVDYYEYSTSNTATTGTKMENGSVTISTDTNTTYYIRAVDKAGNKGAWSDGIKVQIDKSAPTNTAPTATTTTNSVTVTNKQTDQGGSGVKSTQYQIKKNSDSDWGELQDNGNFTGLTQNVKYDVRTVTTDNAGNSTTSEVTTVTTGKVTDLNYDNTTKTGNVTFTAEPSDWTNKTVKVTASTEIAGYTLQSSKTGKDGSWTNANSQSFDEKGTMYVRLWDGTNAGGIATFNVENIDKTAPSQATISGSVITKITDDTIISREGLKVGDYVKYTPDTATYSKDKLAESITGSGNNSADLSTESLNWRVLNIDTMGKVTLVADTRSKTVDFYGAIRI